MQATAQLLSINNVPVISPLSKDAGNAFEIYFKRFHRLNLENKMFEFMRKKREKHCCRC
jgi:hypothetical protein